jgi:bifunctional non-homologous end joining protein LigD
MPKPNQPTSFFPTREYHPAVVHRASTPAKSGNARVPHLKLPKNKNTLDVEFGDDRVVKLTNLGKLFWPKLGVTKRDLIQYYIDVAPVLLPHITERAMVMKRYPNGATSM